MPGSSFSCGDEFIEGPLGSLATVADLLRDGLVDHHVGRDGVVDRTDLRLELSRNLDAFGSQTEAI